MDLAKTIEGLSLDGGEEDEWVLPTEDEEGEWKYELCLVGKFLTNNSITFIAMQNTLANVWQPFEGISIKELGNGRYLFRFFHIVDVDRVMDGTPWEFRRHILVLHRLQKGEDPMEVPLVHTNIWVQIHDLPSGMLTEAMAKQFGNFIGTFVEYDMTNFGRGLRKHLRIRVRIDVRIPLKRRKKLVVNKKSQCYANFKYERLPLFCFLCGLIGHGEKQCAERLKYVGRQLMFEWDNTLRADSRVIRSEQSRWLREEDGSPLNSLGEKDRYEGTENRRGGENQNVQVESEDDPMEILEGKKRARKVGNSAIEVSTLFDSSRAPKGQTSASLNFILADAGVRSGQPQ